MQITATLSGSTATIATSHCGISTSMIVTDATNLASDLAAFTDPDAPSVDATSFTMAEDAPVYVGMKHWHVDVPEPATPNPGYYRDSPRQVRARGYLLDATDDGVRITDPATNGKLTIPSDQIAAVIAGLSA